MQTPERIAQFSWSGRFATNSSTLRRVSAYSRREMFRRSARLGGSHLAIEQTHEPDDQDEERCNTRTSIYRAQR